MSDEVLTVFAAVIGVAVGARVVKAVGKAAGSGIRSVGRGIGEVIEYAAQEDLRNSAFNAGLEGKKPLGKTGNSDLDQELMQNYAAGRDERHLQVNAVSRVVSLNATETRHYIDYDHDD